MIFEQLWGQIEHDLGFYEHSMRRDRPYNGHLHTDTGARGATEVKGLTFRDLRDCYIRAFFLAAHHVKPAHYEEALKGENAALCENDLYGWDLNALDPVAVFQNFSCEVERLMGIYPNVPPLKEITPEERG